MKTSVTGESDADSNVSSDASVLSEDLSEGLLNHSYDGIQEYDNPLPGWWKFLFWVTILISPIYYFYFHAGPESRTIHGQFEAHKAEIMQVRFKDIGDLKGDRETLLKYMKQKEWLAVGKSVFESNCRNCHGGNGEGVIGPNLTDSHWKNVAAIEDLYTVIDQGAANGAMPAWGKRLSHQNLIVLCAAYVASLNENPLPGKEPEGNREIKSWE